MNLYIPFPSWQFCVNYLIILGYDNVCHTIFELWNPSYLCILHVRMLKWRPKCWGHFLMAQYDGKGWLYSLFTRGHSNEGSELLLSIIYLTAACFSEPHFAQKQWGVAHINVWKEPMWGLKFLFICCSITAFMTNYRDVILFLTHSYNLEKIVLKVLIKQSYVTSIIFQNTALIQYRLFLLVQIV